METNLTPTEAAKRLRVTTGTLSNWRVQGRGPVYLKFGRKVLYPLAEIEKFERQHLKGAA
jgi:excisionase family DNA binding protein